MEEWIGLAGVPVVLGLVEAVKRAFPGMEARWWPLVALGWGVSLNIGLALALGRDWRGAILIGVVAGLAASGLYSGGQAVASGKAERGG